MHKPNFFIIGAPKCGATSVSVWLSAHPEIYMSPQKEPHYFSIDIEPSRWRWLGNYERLFMGAQPEHTVIGEASSWYPYSRTAVTRILDYNPEARFLVMVRNPVEMAVSLHQQELFNGAKHVADFSAAWSLQTDRLKGRSISPLCADPQALQYGMRYLLGEQIDRLYSLVPRSRVHVVLLDDIKANARREYLRILEFLGVSDDGRINFPIINPAKARRSFAYARILAVLQLIRSRLPIRRLGWRLLGRLDRFNRKPSSTITIPAQLKQELGHYFSRDVHKLGKLINRDLSHWIS